MAFTENLSAYFADFGVDATLNGEAVRGLFDRAYGEAFGGLVAGNSPVFRLPSEISAGDGDALVIASVNYLVVGVEPDGAGMTLLRLEAA